MVLIDALTKWSYVLLLSTRNVVFEKLLTQIITPKAQFLDYRIKIIYLDNTSEFTSICLINSSNKDKNILLKIILRF